MPFTALLIARRVPPKNVSGSMISGRRPPFSNPGLGSLLAARFPNLSASADRAPADASSKTVTRRRSLLVVEDNPSTRILLVYLLKGNYDVSAAARVDEALGLIHEKNFDGLVLDINLCEERTGIDLLHAIREIPKYKDVPAIACTAYTSFGDRERLLESGFDLYVAKPFTKQQLHEALNLLFEQVPRKTKSGYRA